MPDSQPWCSTTRPHPCGSRTVASHRCQATSGRHARSTNSPAACRSVRPCRLDASTMRCTAIACTGGWQMPEVAGYGGACRTPRWQPQRSGPGK